MKSALQPWQVLFQRENSISISFSASTPMPASGAIIEKAEDRGWIHLVDGTFDLPLIRAETEVFGGEKLRSSIGSIAIDDAQMQVAFGIERNVRGIAFRHAGHAAVGEDPIAAHPLKRVGGGRRCGGGKMDADWDCGESEQKNEQAEFGKRRIEKSYITTEDKGQYPA